MAVAGQALARWTSAQSTASYNVGCKSVIKAHISGCHPTKYRLMPCEQVVFVYNHCVKGVLFCLSNIESSTQSFLDVS